MIITIDDMVQWWNNIIEIDNGSMCKLALTPRSYPPKFGLKLVEIFYDLISDKAGMPSLPERLPPAEVSFAALDFSDVWPEAKMVDVYHYLRGGKDLTIPPSFRDLLPKKLWPVSVT